MAAALEWLARYADSVRAAYGVDPWVFIALVAISMPPFYVAFAIAVRRWVVRRRVRASFAHDRSFLTATAVAVGAWLLPYVYIALFGRLPWWAWALFVVLLVIGAIQLMRTARSRASSASGETESPHE